MESAIICHPFPYVSKGFQSARPSLRFNHATPLCLPHFSTSRSPVTRSLSHATCMVERFSESSHNKGSGGNKILRGMTGASLVLACVLGLLNFSGKMNPKLTIAYACESGTKYNTSMLENTGRFVLESLLQTMREAGASSKDFGPSPDEVNTLKMLALRHCKSGIVPKALELMKEQYEYCKKINSPDSLDSLGMALVELLMFQENYEEARKLLDKQIDQLFAVEKRDHITSTTNQSDILLNLYEEAEPNGYEKVRIAKLILYKAIVHTALENKKGWRKGEIRVQAIAQSMLDNKAWPKEKEAVEWRTTFNKIDN
ncbi:uncharacterized protein LOC109813248 isoform X2 [Cajanus cajan]|uniref:uncharacterized protein LOC109813248 isoform X2 n=1 Tax=Cajanus cajan TaxID=3821 RepID=UPI00098D781A|nr:uncharacterized protein LOC109813248 isoform X2 [Cajanus cajan]